MPDLDALILPKLAALEPSRQRRHLRPVDETLIDVASNDYLGLSRHPLLIERACAWTQRHGAGSRASRLVTGTSAELLALEEKLARFKGTEAALLFATGYQLNSSVLPALFELAPQPLVFTDRLNHASLHAGCRGLKQIRFHHNDLAHLEALLEKHPGDRGTMRWIVTESVFSMDGDRADVAEMSALAARHGAHLYLDEAHATGVLGQHGKGLSAGRATVTMGTLGKALGGAGAYVAGSRALIDWLINRCGGFIYSTAPAPAALGALDAALDLVPTMDAERARLAQMGDALRTALHERGIDTLASSTQIVPAVLGDEARALAAADRLRAAGILVVAIRPPTVPAGSARLRFALSAALTDSQFARVLAAVATL